MRKHIRQPYRNVAILRLKPRCSTEYICNILDLSAGGVRFTADFSFKVGSTFEFLPLRCGQGGLMHLHGEIVWQEQSQDLGYLYGAKLYNSDGEESVELRSEVMQIISKGVLYNA